MFIVTRKIQKTSVRDSLVFIFLAPPVRMSADRYSTYGLPNILVYPLLISFIPKEFAFYSSILVSHFHGFSLKF